MGATEAEVEGWGIPVLVVEQGENKYQVFTYTSSSLYLLPLLGFSKYMKLSGFLKMLLSTHIFGDVSRLC